jgi:hypothetical protein
MQVVAMGTKVQIVPKRRRLYLAVFLTVICIAAGYGMYVLRTIQDFVSVGVRDMYAQWWVADMVIEHMASHDGAWPRNWDDLRRPYATCVQQTGSEPWNFDELRDRVEINFEANPKELAKATPPTETKPPFRVIYLRNGKVRHYQGREANQMVWDYLTTGRVRP